MKAKQNQETGAGVQAAVDEVAAAGGGTVALPPGETVVSETVTLPATVKVEGSAAKQTPAKWAELKGIAPQGDPLRPWVEPIAKSTKECPNGIHLHAADTLHGWSHHAQNYQLPEQALFLSEEDFDKALEAAAGYPACNAHLPAVAKEAPFRAEIVARAEREAKAKADAEAAQKATKDQA